MQKTFSFEPELPESRQFLDARHCEQIPLTAVAILRRRDQKPNGRRLPGRLHREPTQQIRLESTDLVQLVFRAFSASSVLANRKTFWTSPAINP
jgi:hypothetical protein